jgi:hypothetical protein
MDLGDITGIVATLVTALAGLFNDDNRAVKALEHVASNMGRISGELAGIKAGLQVLAVRLTQIDQTIFNIEPASDKGLKGIEEIIDHHRGVIK